MGALEKCSRTWPALASPLLRERWNQSSKLDVLSSLAMQTYEQLGALRVDGRERSRASERWNRRDQGTRAIASSPARST